MRWGQDRLWALSRQREKYGIAKLQRAFVPETGVLVFAMATNHGNWLVITGGLGAPYFGTVGDACSCTGVYTDVVQFVVLSSASSTAGAVTTKVVRARARQVQRYNNVVAWEGDWHDCSYTLATDVTDPEHPATTETFAGWYRDDLHITTGTIVGGVDSTTNASVASAYGAYPDPDPTTGTDAPQTCSLVEPVLSTGLYYTAGVGSLQTNTTQPATFSQTQATLFKFEPRLLTYVYSPVTGYSFTLNPTGGTETFSTVPVPPGADPGDPSTGATWTSQQEAEYMWSLGYSALRGVRTAAAPESIRLAVDQAAYDAEYPLWLAREEARALACVTAVADTLDADMTDMPFASAVAGALRTLDSDFFADTLAGSIPPARAKCKVFALEYDYVLDGTPDTSPVVPPLAMVTAARVVSGISTFLYQDDLTDSLALVPPADAFTVLDEKDHVGESIAVSSSVGNMLVMLVGPDGAAQRLEFLSRLLEKNNVVADLDEDSDKVLSIFYAPLPDPVV